MSRNDEPFLEVRMLGGFSVNYGGAPVFLNKRTMTKAMKLLIILLYSGEEGISRNRLLENLYEREELEDASNNLRVTVYRLRKILKESELPDFNYVNIKDGIYSWECPMKIKIDVFVFAELIRRAEEETDEKCRAEFLQRACSDYRGEFLPLLTGDSWILIENVQYKKMYTNALETVCKYMKRNREYEKMLGLCEAAIQLYPFEEWQSIKIDALLALNRYKEALKVYEDTAKLFFEELGISPSERMMDQFNEMSVKMSLKPQAIQNIKYGLYEEEAGAFYCGFPGFRDGFRLVRRIVERSGQSVYLVLCSITDGQGHPMENKEKRDIIADTLHRSIKKSLRRGDSFTKYSPNQFLMLLIGISQENCSIVCDRIVRLFSKEHRTWGQYLEFHISSISEVKKETSKISFIGKDFYWKDE